MLRLDRSDMHRISGAAIGALILTATMVGAAVGPARAIERAPAYAHIAPSNARA